jgi:hypothetical protein
MSEPHGPDLLLRLSLPSSRDFSAVAPEVVSKISELLGRGAEDARAAAGVLEGLLAEVAPEEGAGEIAFEFHHANGELRMEARCAGRSSTARHPLPT